MEAYLLWPLWRSQFLFPMPDKERKGHLLVYIHSKNIIHCFCLKYCQDLKSVPTFTCLVSSLIASYTSQCISLLWTTKGKCTWACNINTSLNINLEDEWDVIRHDMCTFHHPLLQHIDLGIFSFLYSQLHSSKQHARQCKKANKNQWCFTFLHCQCTVKEGPLCYLAENISLLSGETAKAYQELKGSG